MSTSENLANTESLMITARNQIKRLPQRGQYDRAVIHQILDEGLVCHLGFSVDGQPFVIPTAYGRVGDHLTFTVLQPVGCCNPFKAVLKFV